MTSDPVFVREATVDDAETIACFGSQAFRQTNAPIVGPAAAEAAIAQTYSVSALKACITSCAQTTDAFFLVAIQEGEVVGFLHYATAGGIPELHRIYVHPDRKRTGIGTALLDALHTRIPRKATYRLIVAAENTDARAFYEHCGFRVATHVDHGHLPGVALPADAPLVPVLILTMRLDGGRPSRPGLRSSSRL